MTPGRFILAEPSNDTPPIVLADSNLVAVLELPVKGPTKDEAVIIPLVLILLSVPTPEEDTPFHLPLAESYSRV